MASPFDVFKTDVQDVSPAEMRLAYSGPAYQANKFFINVGPTGVRVAFAEVVPGLEEGPQFRTAVNMSLEDAVSLSVVLREVIEKAVRVEVNPQTGAPAAAKGKDGGN